MTRETTRLAELADQLRALHHGARALVLPNAWDAASARGRWPMAGAPDVQRLTELGVRRISLAGRPHRAAMTELQRRLEAIKGGAWPTDELSGWQSRRQLTSHPAIATTRPPERRVVSR